MRRVKTVDRHPGPLPEIRMDGRSVVFTFDATSGEQGARLVLRCDEDGEVFASISTLVSSVENRRQP